MGPDSSSQPAQQIRGRRISERIRIARADSNQLKPVCLPPTQLTLQPNPAQKEQQGERVVSNLSRVGCNIDKVW